MFIKIIVFDLFLNIILRVFIVRSYKFHTFCFFVFAYNFLILYFPAIFDFVRTNARLGTFVVACRLIMSSLLYVVIMFIKKITKTEFTVAFLIITLLIHIIGIFLLSLYTFALTALSPNRQHLINSC